MSRDGCQINRAERAVGEIVLRDPRHLIEAEGDLELADLDLRVVHICEIDVDIFPERLAREPELDIVVGQLLLVQLALDFVLDAPEQVPLNADPAAVQLPRLELGERRHTTGGRLPGTSPENRGGRPIPRATTDAASR